MKSEYFKNYVNLKESNKSAYDSYLQRINHLFQSIQQDPQIHTMVRLESQLHAAKDHRELKVKDKRPIFKYFVERNIQDFHLLQENNSIELRLLKMTKTQLEDYQLNWKEIWERLLEKQPQIPTIRLYNEMVDFLRILRHLYSPDNALEVVDYFMQRHSLYTDNLCLYLSLFINITQKTSPSIFTAYLQRIIELYHLNQLKASDLLIMYINASKFKQAEVPEAVHSQLTKIVLYSISTPSSQKKESIQPKFSTQTANIIFRIIGKCNQHSVYLLQQVFQLLKLFIRPFEDSKKPLKLLCLFIMGISKRIQTQDGYRQKIAKLRVKEQKIKQKKKTQAKAIEPSSQQQQTQGEQTPLTVIQLSKTEQKPAELKVAEKVEAQKLSQQQSDEDQEQQHDSDDEDQDNKVEKMITMELELEEAVPEKTATIQTKIQKLESLLRNQITQEIKLVVKDFMAHHLQEIFYVNSKKMVSRILKECFKLFPELIPKSLQVLQKAGNIPQINEDGLISNIKHIAKFIFSKDMIEKGLCLENVLRLLARVKQHRRITDVWDIMSAFIQKIPLLDEKDMQKVPQQQKEQFLKKYGHNHDRFYQSYSEQIFECIKRLFSESQYYDPNASSSSEKHIIDLINNSYPQFKKRVLHQMQQQILENNNKFLLSIFHSGLRPSKKFQISLKEMIDNGNIESEQNMTLDISVNTILSIDMDIESIKKLIRRYSKKNNYKFLKQCMLSMTNYNFIPQHFESSLEYFEKKPEFRITQEPPFVLVEEKMRHVNKYVYELVNELFEEIKQFEQMPLQNISFQEIVIQIYGSKENTFKNMKVEKRKTINELLQILKNITQYLFHQFQDYNPQKGTIQFKPAPYQRQSLLINPKFKKIIDCLIYNELFLHDPNIMHNLSNLIENQVYFSYRHHIRLQKQIWKKYAKKNTREELLGESNLNYMNNIAISKARVAHFSILFNKYRDVVNINDISNQLRILVVAPGNDKSNSVNKILVKKTESFDKEADKLIILLSKTIPSRFYYQKVFSLLGDFLSSGYKFKSDQIISIINAHIPLIQSENIKIKEHSLKSLEKFFRHLHKTDLFGPVEIALREFAKRQKLELIWMIALLIIVKEGKKSTSTEEYLTNIYEYLQILEPLIQSEARIVRRIAIFAYSFCYRRAKQAIKTVQRVECPNVKYSKPKKVNELFQTGYLREEQIADRQIAGKQMLKKLAPYSTYRIKKYLQLQIFKKIEQTAFNFILNSPELGLKILKQFHIDMAASVQQILSMMHNKKHDLSEIAVRNLEGCYVYAKLYKLHYDRFQHHFGQNFFKYLFNKDAKSNQFNFFRSTKGEVQQLLANLQTYDNQTLLFIYLTDLISAYQAHQSSLSEQTRAQIQTFVQKMLQAMLYKGSGSVFKQLMLLLSKIKYPQQLSFISNYLKKMIKNKQKVSRASQLLFNLCEDNYEVYTETTEFILGERIEINHNFITTLLNLVITLPEKYMLTSKTIQKYGIIDLQSQLSQKNIQKLNNMPIYISSTHTFNSFLVKIIQNYIQLLGQTQPTNEQSSSSSKNQFLKATYSITTSCINHYAQFYQTSETISTIQQLLQLMFQLFEYKMDLALDYKQLQDTIKNLIANKYDNIRHFQEILTIVISHTHRLPVKKQADIIKIISNRPGNFHFVQPLFYKQFINKLLLFEEHSMIYKEILLSLSTLLAYVPLPLEQIKEILGEVNKGQGLLLMQAYVMSTEDIGNTFVEVILNGSVSARRNMFCKQMLQLRGKKEYLDDEERYIQWKKIKQYSNPYHYHA